MIVADIDTNAAEETLELIVQDGGVGEAKTIDVSNHAEVANLIKSITDAMPIDVLINMASIVASVGIPDRFAYSMTKGAVLTMTYSIAKDYINDGIRCNCISPARVHTPFVDQYLEDHYPDRKEEMFEQLSNTQPIGRMGTPDEVAAFVDYLCSDDASFITGSNFPIDGGFVTLNN